MKENFDDYSLEDEDDMVRAHRHKRNMAGNQNYIAANEDEPSDEYNTEEEETRPKDKEASVNYIADREDGDMDEDDSQSEQDSESEQDSRANHSSPFMLLLKMMVNPIEGWKKIRRSGLSPDDIARGCFYPISAAAAASCFTDCIYHEDTTLSECVIKGVTTFVAFFFGYYLVIMLERLLFPKEAAKKGESDFGKIFVMMNLSTLALFLVLYQCLQMLGPVLAFLPLWTIYLAIRGGRFFRFDSEKNSLMITLLCLFILGAPIAVFWVFGLIL